MKPFLVKRKSVSRAAARNVFLINQFATPGLGSLMARRWIAGTGQILLAVAGCAMVIVWFFEVIHRYYVLMFSDESQLQSAPGWTGATGAILFVASWLWALVTSINLLRQAKMDEQNRPEVPPTIAGSDQHSQK